jgi:S1-C subfamily serine protease
VPGSPAEAAGLRAGDTLLSVGGKELPGLKALSSLLKALEPGKVELKYLRGGKESTGSADLVPR